MPLDTLSFAFGSSKRRKRIGRGVGSGQGGTSTRGHKGAKSRSGYKRKHGFEGGQLPLQRRVPKYGFKQPHRVCYKPINLCILQQLVEKKKLTTLDAKTLASHGLIATKDCYKILNKGMLKEKISIQAHACSAAARSAIEELGGEVIITGG